MKRNTIDRLIARVRRTITEHDMIEENEHIVIGLSGGPDSVCLFDILFALSGDMKLTLYPVHVDHSLRGADSDGDRIFSEELCSSRGLKCRTYKYDVRGMSKAAGVSEEEMGRKLRYDAFSDAAREAERLSAGKAVIAVAQNADDRAETVLFRMMRGTGTDGMTGISHVRTDETGRKIVRPLLDVYKEDILEYCNERELSPRFDKTNGEPAYSRNRIRLELIPYLEREYNRNIKKALVGLADSAEEDRRCLEKQARGLFDKALVENDEKAGRLMLDRGLIAEAESAVSRRVLRLALEETGLREDMIRANYEALGDILRHGGPSANVDLPHGYFLRNVYDRIVVGGPKKNVRKARKLKITVMTREELGVYENKGVSFDREKLSELLGCKTPEEHIKLRRRVAGDRIKTRGGTKKLQNLFVDLKIPREERDYIDVVAAGSTVLFWSGGMSGASAAAPVTDDTKTVVCIELLESV